MNTLDKQYTDLLQDILDNGVKKEDRTGTGTISVFGRQIRHKMSEGFPLLTTKKMPFKTITTELLWFLRGDTNIKYLVDNNCHIWDGDAYKNYLKWFSEQSKVFVEQGIVREPWTKEQYIEQIKLGNVDSDLSDLGPVYGKQWRSWHTRWDVVEDKSRESGVRRIEYGIDQIANLISELKTNPDSRRLMVSAWNVGELDNMTLPPCHYGFQVYTRELSENERYKIFDERGYEFRMNNWSKEEQYDKANIPKRAISLIWSQRSVDSFLGLPFNIASYGLLLEIIAKEVNMVPDELIGNLGDTHLYLNHIEQAKEQIGREHTEKDLADKMIFVSAGYIQEDGSVNEKGQEKISEVIKNLPNRTREPYPLPTLVMVTNPELKFDEYVNDNFRLVNYQSHPTIKAPLSN